MVEDKIIKIENMENKLPESVNTLKTEQSLALNNSCLTPEKSLELLLDDDLESVLLSKSYIPTGIGFIATLGGFGYFLCSIGLQSQSAGGVLLLESLGILSSGVALYSLGGFLNDVTRLKNVGVYYKEKDNGELYFTDTPTLYQYFTNKMVISANNVNDLMYCLQNRNPEKTLYFLNNIPLEKDAVHQGVTYVEYKKKNGKKMRKHFNISYNIPFGESNCGLYLNLNTDDESKAREFQGMEPGPIDLLGKIDMKDENSYVMTPVRWNSAKRMRLLDE
jgi:hypothetical protein